MQILLFFLTVLPTSQIINALLLGGLLGATGQGIRALVGVKKLREENRNKGVVEEFNQSRLIGSLCIGFIAGVLATLPFFSEDFSKEPQWTQQVILTLITAGYAGVDFIEGFLNTHLTEKKAVALSPDSPIAPDADDLSIAPNQTVAG